MRLTLRTLLAYMDDILEPADHEDLGKKIEASDFATELIHRSRDTVRRLRLGAPAVLSDGSDDVLDSVDLSDANSVAEYLVNTLPPEQVAEFERMCLEPGTEPDMHLAEVASCHHVLTMVLGEPADVDSKLKSQMYQLPSQAASGQKLRIEPAHISQGTPQAPPVQTAAPVAPPQVASSKPESPKVMPASTVDHELPDYLREAAASKRRSRRWAIAMTLAALGAIGFWLANPPAAEPPADVASNEIDLLAEGEIDIQMPDAEMGGVGNSEIGDADTSGDAPPFNPGTTEAPVFVPESSDELVAAPPFNSGEPTAETAEVGTSPIVETESPAATVEEPAVDSAIEMAVGAPAPVSNEGPTEKATASAPPALDNLPGTQPDTQPTEIASGDATAEVGEQEPILVASVPDASKSVTPMKEESTTPSVEDLAEAPEVIEPQPVGPQRLGSYLGNNDVLLIYSEAQDQWVRMPPRSPISTGDQLLTLPRYFTHVVLADVNAYLSGGTRLHVPMERFNASTGATELNLDLVYGRMMLNAGLKGSQVAIQVDDQLREFKLEGSASLAVNVERMFVPGNDYENQAAPTKATWYLTSGSVEWPTATGGTQMIEGQMTWTTIDGIDEIPEPIGKLPAWIAREPMTDMQRSARDDLSKELEVDRPVGLRLLELTDGKGLGRRREVRSLAAASSVYVGEFEPLVKALNDSEQKNVWDMHIHDLRQAMALSPDVASSIRQAFVSIRGEEAAEDLMELVQGYNPEQIGTSREAIQSGALSQLLKWLDHDSLDYRVLAINNIRAITGKTKGYRADDSVKGRKKNLRKLLAEFEANELMPQF